MKNIKSKEKKDGVDIDKILSNIKKKYKQSIINLNSEDTAYLNYLSNIDFREIYYNKR